MAILAAGCSSSTSPTPPLPKEVEGPWVVYEGGQGPGAGKQIVLISGDEEYRSEEALPQLAKILAERHGFRCTVLFAIDPATGQINPNVQTDIPGLKALLNADLAIVFTRYRALPPEQMQFIESYLKRGQPVLGIRTATHAFKFNEPGPWSHYGNAYEGEEYPEWAGGFGRLVLGEQWVNHHGKHKHESTLGIIAPGAEDHPITRGLKDGDIWGPTDVYGVELPFTDDRQPIILGQVMQRKGEFDQDDTYFGMRPDDGPPVAEKNDPMMPIAWTRTYQIPGGQQGEVFTSTIGAATDLTSEGTRRLLVNGVYWLLGMENQIPPDGTNVELVGEFEPSQYGTRKDPQWEELDLRPEDFRLEEAPAK